MSIKNLLAGYVAVLFASPADDDSNPEGNALIASEGKGKNAREVRRIEDLLIPFPTTAESLAQACEGLEFVVTDVDGQSHKFTGVSAAVAMKYKHAAETIRGMLRARNESGSFKYTDDQIRAYAESFNKIAGRDYMGTAKAVVNEDDFNTPEGIARIKEALARAGQLVRA